MVFNIYKIFFRILDQVCYIYLFINIPNITFLLIIFMRFDLKNVNKLYCTFNKVFFIKFYIKKHVNNKICAKNEFCFTN